MVVLPYGFLSLTHDDRLRILGAPDFQTNRCVAWIYIYAYNSRESIEIIYIYIQIDRITCIGPMNKMERLFFPNRRLMI